MAEADVAAAKHFEELGGVDVDQSNAIHMPRDEVPNLPEFNVVPFERGRSGLGRAHLIGKQVDLCLWGRDGAEISRVQRSRVITTVRVVVGMRVLWIDGRRLIAIFVFDRISAVVRRRAAVTRYREEDSIGGENGVADSSGSKDAESGEIGGAVAPTREWANSVRPKIKAHRVIAREVLVFGRHAPAS